MERWARAAAAVVLAAVPLEGGEGLAGSGLVVGVDRAAGALTVSCAEGPAFPEPRVQSFVLPDATRLQGLGPGTLIDFTLPAGETGRLEDLRVRRHGASDAQGLEVERLELLERIAGPASSALALEVGAPVPDFSLIDQNGRAVSLSGFAGKVVAVSFMYTSCHSPEYCFRSTNNLGLVQRRFADRLGRELVLLTLTFDPVHDQPEVLARYGATWKADARGWHLLTGPEADVRKACALFGMNVWPQMGMLAHDLHTAVIGRDGRLAANLEGNDFTARQLGDLIEAQLGPAR